MHPHRTLMRPDRALTLLPRALAVAALTWIAVVGTPRAAQADLIRPDAKQSFPDLQGNIVGTQSYVYDPTSQTGTFQVNNAPVLVATGPQTTTEYYVSDSKDTVRSQTIQVKLDSTGKLLNDPSNTFALYGSVKIGDKTFEGLLLEGKPTAFGFDPHPGSLPHYDLNVSLTGGKLRELYGPDAYISVITETNNTFSGSFAQTFQASKPITNVRAYNAPPLPVPEPSTLVVLLAFGGAGWLFRRRRGAKALTDLRFEE
ncbi:MAG: PEP-CTERM sorting domain-containing protein [Isosphaeraceae bacterium]